MRKFMTAVLCVSLIVPWLMPSGSAKAVAAENHYLGQIKLFAYGKAPDGWLYCNGQTLPISGNSALFALIGIMYGGNGSENFAVPDLRVKEPAGGVGYYIATSGLTPSQSGSSAHDVFLGEIQLFPYAFVPSGFTKASGQVLAILSNTALFSLLGTSYGGNGSNTFQLPNMKPLDDAGVFYAIATEGLFPSNGVTGLGTEYAGEIGLFPYPSSYLSQGLMVDGQTLGRSGYPALFASIGTRFGAEDSATFKLPDLTGANPTLLGGASFPAGFTIYQMFNGTLPALSSAAAPGAGDDAFTTQAGSITVAAPGLLVNDSAASGAMVTKQPEHGSVSLDSNGAFVYTADHSYQGTDKFTYKSYSNWGSSVEATVNLSEMMPVVTFDANGGSGVASQHVYAGQAVAEPTDPTRTGYAFAGWYADIALSSAYSFTAPVTDNTTLFAKWTAAGEIVSAIERAEREQTQFAANAAALLVQQMNDSPEKEALLDRLAYVQDIIDNRDLHLDQIIRLLADGTLAEKDLNGDQVFDAADVVIFLQRISLFKTVQVEPV